MAGVALFRVTRNTKKRLHLKNSILGINKKLSILEFRSAKIMPERMLIIYRYFIYYLKDYTIFKR